MAKKREKPQKVSQPQSHGEKIRERIVLTALQLFARKGFQQTSVQEIADECGITQPAIFIHFKKKVDLLDAVRKYVSKSNHQFVDNLTNLNDDAFTALINHCEGNLSWGIRHPEEAQIILLTYYYSFFDPHFIEIFPSVIGLGTERILKYVAAGVREKLFFLKVSESETANLIHEYLVGCFVRNLPARSTKKLSVPEKQRLAHFLTLILGKNL